MIYSTSRHYDIIQPTHKTGATMSNYTAKQNDTFELISRRMFGTANETGNIRKANPSLKEPLSAGDSVFIPASAKDNKPSKQTSTSSGGAIAESRDQVVVMINGQEYRFFNSIEFYSRFDSFDSCIIAAPFEPDNLAFRKTFVPFSYADVDVFIGDELVFSGTQMGLTPQVTATSKVVTIEAYARCAVTNDSSLPVSSYPIELRGLKLDRIAQEICKPFPFKVKTNVDVGAKFESASIKQQDKIYPFLVELAKQRDLLISNDENGDLLITRAVDENSVAQLYDDASPVLSVTPTHDNQNYFSDYTAIIPIMIDGLPAATYTAKNKRLQNVLRVENYEANDAFNGEERQIAESRRARALANSISYQVSLATIRDPQGNLYTPNSYINLTAPTAMIYNDTKLFIRSVTLSLDGDSKTCTLDLVLPESFNGQDLERFPWED